MLRALPRTHTRAGAMSLYTYWAPEPDNVPPWAAKKGDWWYCEACWKYLDEKHVKSHEHSRRVYVWMQRQHSVALSAAWSAARAAEAWSAARAAEARPSGVRSPTESADRGSVNPEDWAELRVLLRSEQVSASAAAVPSAASSAASSAHGGSVSRGDLAELHSFLYGEHKEPPTLVAASPPAAGWNPAGAEGPQQMRMMCVNPTAKRFQISTPPTPPPPRPIATSITATAAADEKPPMLAPCPAAASPPAAGWGPAGSEEPQQMRMMCTNRAPTPFQTSPPPPPPPPRPISTSIPPPPLLCPDASISAAGSTPVGYDLPRETWMTFVNSPTPTAGSDYFSRYDTRFTYNEGNVRIEYMRNGQRALALTMPADDATRLAAALTRLVQLARGMVLNMPRSGG